jgi:hypothetical protein
MSLSTFSTERGQVIDRFNGVEVYYNGKKYTNVSGRNVTKEGYNLGLKYQCVEFVKRYYYERFNHFMPYSYGHAYEFFDKSLPDKAYNEERGLMQFRNVRREKPKVEDIIIYNATNTNPFGHMGIVTKVTNNKIEFVQQNFGTKTRQTLKLVEFQGIYTIADYDILGWLRKVE